MAMFGFGKWRKTVSRKGDPAEVTEYALHVQCHWRIRLNDEVLVGLRDIYCPADGPPSQDFDFETSGPNKLDKGMAVLFENRSKAFVVQEIQAPLGGSLNVNLERGYALELFPDDTHGGEYWRLFVPGSTEKHFVVGPSGFSSE